MEKDLISQGLELTLFGMGTVVVFLTLLVFVTSGMSAFVAKYFPAPPAPPAPAAARAAVEPVTDATLLAVIAAAVHQHRLSQAPLSQQKREQNS